MIDLHPGAPGGLRVVDAMPHQPLDPSVVRFAELRGVATKEALLDELAADLELPSWFGRNWDALEEALGFADDERAVVILWHDPDRLPAGDRATAESVFAAASGVRAAARRRPLLVYVARSDAAEDRPMAKPAGRVPDSIRRLGKVHHVALIVRSIEEANAFWRDALGLELETVMDIAQDRVKIAFLGVGESKVELVEPTDDTTGVARFLAAKGEGFHHVCFEVPNLAETLLRLEIDGLELIDTAPRRGAEGPVAFIHPRSCHGVLVELIEAPGGPAWISLGFGS